jgi:hypothetical protein
MASRGWVVRGPWFGVRGPKISPFAPPHHAYVLGRLGLAGKGLDDVASQASSSDSCPMAPADAVSILNRMLRQEAGGQP